MRHTRALTVCAAIAHDGAPIGNHHPGETENIHWPYGYVAAGDISGRLLVWNLRLIIDKDRRVGKAPASSKVHVLSSNEVGGLRSLDPLPWKEARKQARKKKN